MNEEPKQIIVVRRDLKMKKGKLAAQAAHASVSAVFQESTSLNQHPILRQWLLGASTKIVVGCDSEAELFELRDRAVQQNIRHAIIQDAGRTVFKEPTYTCLGLGPELPSILDPLVSHLKLL